MSSSDIIAAQEAAATSWEAANRAYQALRSAYHAGEAAMEDLIASQARLQRLAVQQPGYLRG